MTEIRGHVRRVHVAEQLEPTGHVFPVRECPSAIAAEVESSGYEVLEVLPEGRWHDYNLLVRSGGVVYMAAVY